MGRKPFVSKATSTRYDVLYRSDQVFLALLVSNPRAIQCTEHADSDSDARRLTCEKVDHIPF